MPILSSQAKTVVAAFGQQSGVTQEHVDNLRTVLNGSPVLLNQFNEAVSQGHLEQILPLANAHAGGEYDGISNVKAMRLPLASLTTPPSGTSSFDPEAVAFVLGHELQHGFNHAGTQQAYRDFLNEVAQKAQEPGLPHDYTLATGRLIAANRRDEAAAEIAGWNAVVSMVESSNQNPTLRDIYHAAPSRTSDFIDQTGTHPTYSYALKPNLTLNQDLSLSASPVNLEAMGRNFFDKTPIETRLGHHGNSDYANYYGAYAVGKIAQTERAYNPPHHVASSQPFALNLGQLRLSEKLLEENGIDLGKHTQPMPYLDSCQTSATAHLFQHTASSHAHTLPISAQAFEVALANQARPMRDQVSAVADLQTSLIQLGYHHRVNQPLQVNGVNDTATQQAVTVFQARNDLPINGIADLATQQALQQALLAQQQAERFQAEREAREQARKTEQEQATRNDVHASVGLQPFSDPHHPQHALYADVLQRFGAKGIALSEAQLSDLTRQMQGTGYEPGWQGDVTVHRDRAVVGSFQIGSRMASIELSTPAPSVQDTMKAFQTEQQEKPQALESPHQQQTLAQEHGRGLGR